MDAKTFGAFLARMRKSQGLTQAELAQQLHVTDKAVSRWERGVGLPDINTLEPLAAGWMKIRWKFPAGSTIFPVITPWRAITARRLFLPCWAL